MTISEPQVLVPRPDRVCNAADFVLELDRLRRRAALGTTKQRIGLDRLSRLSGIPRSSLHEYLAGTCLPPTDRLDALVLALGASPDEARDWARALDRLVDAAMTLRATPSPELTTLPTHHPAVRLTRARNLLDVALPPGLEHLRQPSDGHITITATVCNTWSGTFVYAEPDRAAVRTGYLNAGNNWFLWQTRAGMNPPREDLVSDVWLYTQADVAHGPDGGWGWAPANVIAGSRPFEIVGGLPVVDRPGKSGSTVP